jgi:hypothetical protein
MKAAEGKAYANLTDRNGAIRIEDTRFTRCVFDNCAFSLTKDPDRSSMVANCEFIGCSCLHNCDIGPAVLEDVTVDGLKIDDLLLLWSPRLKHVTLRGRIGEVKINASAHYLDKSPELQEPFDRARDRFYAHVDWALDIAEAEFADFEAEGIPARLVRRDPRTQAIVTRAKALQPGWRKRLSRSNTHWPFVIDMFLEDERDDIVLVASKGKPKTEFQRLVDGLRELRDLGVAEPD